MKVDSFKLKIFAMILMLLDHIRYFIPEMPLWLHMLGRISAPIFFYLVIEGFFHTSSRKEYFKRLFIGGIIMFFGSRTLELLMTMEKGIHMNIFFSLAFAVAIMDFSEKAKMAEGSKEKRNCTSKVMLFVLLSIFTEANIIGLGMIVAFYCFRESKEKMAITYIILSIAMVIFGGYQWMMVFALPFIFMYDGERGINNKFTKYLFYIFYPLHIWGLYIIAAIISK